MSWGYAANTNRSCPPYPYPDRWAGFRGTRRDHVQSRALDRGTHLVRGVLGVGLALGSAPGHGAGADVAEVDLPLGGRPAAGLTPHNDGAARQDLLGETPHTISGHSLVH